MLADFINYHFTFAHSFPVPSLLALVACGLNCRTMFLNLVRHFPTPVTCVTPFAASALLVRFVISPFVHFEFAKSPRDLLYSTCSGLTLLANLSFHLLLLTSLLNCHL